MPAAEITFQPPPSRITPTVSVPPPAADRPPTTWRRVTAWPTSPARAASLTSSSPSAVTPRNSLVFASTHARAAASGVVPETPVASVPPASTSVDGVPNWFHAT